MIQINGKQYEYQEGLTVSTALRMALGKPRLEYLASLNGSFILRSEWDMTPVPDGATLSFIPIASGG